MASCDPWTEKEMVMILESDALARGNRDRNQCLFSLQCATGGRVSELLGLRRQDVLDDLGRIRERISFYNTKNGETRTVDLINPFPMPFLKRWLVVLEEMGYFKRNHPLFSNPTGRAMSRTWWYKVIVKACLECELPGSNYGTHSARKTWARDTYKHYHARAMNGELIDPLLKLQEAGGWKTIEAARRYISFMLGDTKTAQKALYPDLQAKYGNL